MESSGVKGMQYFLMAGLKLPGFAAVESQLCSQGEFLAVPDFLQLVEYCCLFSDPAVQFMVNISIIIDGPAKVCKVFCFQLPCDLYRHLLVLDVH